MLSALALALSSAPSGVLVGDPNGRAGADDPIVRAPSADASPHEVFAWTSEGGLRFTWTVPKGYDGARARNLTVICHGTGLDYRWGHWNNPPGVFRPDDVVVSVDGPTPAEGGTRLFLGEREDAQAIRDFLHELRELFAVERTFLYGHSQGGFFVVYFAGEFPGDVDGVVAHASGAWNWSKTGKDVARIPIAFMHGTADPVVPFGQSPGARDFYAEEGFARLHLRRLELYNHWPNAVRANECLAWCEGMGDDDPARVLDLARECLRPKGKDEYQWETAPDFSAGQALLDRLLGRGPQPLDAVPEALKTSAQRVQAAVDLHGEKHVAALKKALGGSKLESDAKAGMRWLGHLVALFEDLRGVACVEALRKELGYDKALAKHAKRSEPIFTAWHAEGATPASIYTAVVEHLGDAFLVEGFPPDLGARMAEWHEAREELELPKKAVEGFAIVEAWRDGWSGGRKDYAELWRTWKGAPGE
jgi:predicted esterase